MSNIQCLMKKAIYYSLVIQWLFFSLNKAKDNKENCRPHLKSLAMNNFHIDREKTTMSSTKSTFRNG